VSVARPERAIIIAAGMGRRLQPYTDTMPKCLVPVRGRPMIARQIEAFRAHGVQEIVVIRGYKAEVLEARRGELGDVRFVENVDFQKNNILQSLFKARAELQGAVYLTYADIVFARDVVAALAAAPGDAALIVDRDYHLIYEGRDQHPLSEAEVARVDDTGAVRAVGKRSTPPAEAWGEFIGLAKLSAAGTAAMVAAYASQAARYAGREDEPFGRNTWRNAYLTDLFEHMIAEGTRFEAVPIRGRWREIDTVQDLERAEAAVDW
jgi:choline kinase